MYPLANVPVCECVFVYYDKLWFQTPICQIVNCIIIFSHRVDTYRQYHSMQEIYRPQHYHRCDNAGQMYGHREQPAEHREQPAEHLYCDEHSLYIHNQPPIHPYQKYTGSEIESRRSETIQGSTSYSYRSDDTSHIYEPCNVSHRGVFKERYNRDPFSINPQVVKHPPSERRTVFQYLRRLFKARHH